MVPDFMCNVLMCFFLLVVFYFAFRWCKSEVMLPYVPGDKFKLTEEKKEAGYSDSVTKDSYAIEEADSSFEYMKVMLLAIIQRVREKRVRRQVDLTIVNFDLLLSALYIRISLTTSL